jgi:hypothetical protein
MKIVSIAFHFFLAGVFFLVMRYGADLAFRQSIVLAVLLMAIVWGLNLIAGEPTSNFIPYYVFIEFNWQRILLDFKLLKNQDEWGRLSSQVKDIPAQERSILRDNLFLYFLQSNPSQDQRLIFYRNTFVSEIDLWEDIAAVKLPREDDHSLGESSPSIFVKQHFGGYAIGLQVPEWWWKLAKSSCPTPCYEETTNHLTGQVELTLAVIPPTEFLGYWQRGDWSRRSLKEAEFIRKRRDAELSKYGWQDATRKRDAELGISWPRRIQHLYVTIHHEAI